MSFFSKLFGGVDANERFNKNVSKVYKGFKADRVHIILPGGEGQAKRIIKSIALILEEDSSRYNATKCEKVLQVYVSIFSRIILNQMNEERIRLSILAKEKELVSESNVDRIIAFTTITMHSPDFELSTAQDDELIKLITDYSAASKDNQNKNEGVKNYHIGEEDYGLVLNKPVYTSSINGSNHYLSNLRSELGEKLTWDRMGSYVVSDVDGMVDQYEMYLPSGELYRSIYINMYSKTTAKDVPKGFLMAE